MGTAFPGSQAKEADSGLLTRVMPESPRELGPLGLKEEASFFFLSFCYFFGPLLQHMELPRLGV